jgi:hypothetical protein
VPQGVNRVASGLRQGDWLNLAQHPGPTTMVQDPEDKESGARSWSGVDERLQAAGAAWAAWLRPDRARKDAPAERPPEPADPQQPGGEGQRP